MDQDLNAIRRAVLADPEDPSLWRRLLDKARTCGWTHQDRGIDSWWMLATGAIDDGLRDSLLEELAAAGPIPCALFLDRLAHHRWRDQITAAAAFAFVERPPMLALQALRQCLLSRIANLSRVAFRSLQIIAPEDPETLAVLEQGLASADAFVQLQCATALKEIGREDHAVAAISAGLDNPNSAVRVEAAANLGSLGNPRAFEALRARLRDPAWNVRAGAVHAIGRLTQVADSPEAFEALTPLLDDPDPRVRDAALSALFESDLERTCAALLPIARDGTRRRRIWATAWLVSGAPRRPELAPLLLQLMDRDDPESRLAAITGLRELLSRNREAELDLPAVRDRLVALLPDRHVGRVALRVLLDLPEGPGAAFAFLAARARHPSATERALAARALAGALPSHPPNEAPLWQLLADPEPQVRWNAALPITSGGSSEIRRFADQQLAKLRENKNEGR